MNTLRLSAALLSAGAFTAASVAQVAPPAKRADTLAQAQALLAPRESALPPPATNPFFSEAFATQAGLIAPAPAAGADAAANAAARPAGPRSTRDLLAAIADGLRPSGYIVMGGVPSLSFGQKRVKAGDTLTITFEGSEYTVEIAAIDRTHFTVRLGNETHTRPIR